MRPESVDELAQILSHEKGSVVPIGAATQQYFGNPLRVVSIAPSTRQRLNRITEYVPGDLTIHAEAGTTLGELEHALAEHNQLLPLDPWNGSAATIGGIAAANAQGPYRATGTIRDWIIGMKVVDVNGRISKTGGRVVKNVTGYDLAKLYTGSIGSLAIITEISLKLAPEFCAAPQRQSRRLQAFEGSQQRCLARSERARVQPIACEWIGSAIRKIWVRFGEHPRAVDWQLKNLPQADWRIVEGSEEARYAWKSLRGAYAGLGPILLKVISLPSNAQDIVEEFRPNAWIAHALNGIVLLSVSDPAAILRIRAKYPAVIERAPLEVRRMVATFGVAAAEYELMLKMKHAFDPDGRLNPGRHIDGER